MGKSPDHPITRSLDAAHPITRSPDAVVLPRLYAIIDPAQSGGRPPIEVAEALLAAGVRLIQLRDKHASSGELYQTAQRVGERVRRAEGSSSSTTALTSPARWMRMECMWGRTTCRWSPSARSSVPAN